jgi:hypothetical protein
MIATLSLLALKSPVFGEERHDKGKSSSQIAGETGPASF